MTTQSMLAPTRPRSRRRSRALAVAAAVVLPSLIWMVTVLAFDHRLIVTDGSGSRSQEIGLPPVILLSLVVSLLGWGLLALLERFTRRAGVIWAVVAVLALGVSFLPLTGPGTAWASRVALGLMHVTVAAVLLTVFLRTSTTAPGRTQES
ncbi:DUF6069 family protein [Micromonospora sp. NPDC048830]|uniref:DUF6069 family protein n=1 Tax=Micromonospora sp. NPDC048830 TaxID=3364257 RepID=UPI00372270AE